MRIRRRFVIFLASVAPSVLATARSASADDAACIAASEQSIGLRRDGHLHAALKQLALCADAACPDEMKTECVRRIDAVNAAMPTLVLVAKEGSGNDLSSVVVTMDGTPFAPSLDGRPLSVDPGEHMFRFETAGQPPLEKKLVLREGEKDRRETVVLGPPPPTVVPPPPAPPAVAAPPPSSWSTQRTLAIASGVVGVLGVGLGIDYTGVFRVVRAERREEELLGVELSECSAEYGGLQHRQEGRDRLDHRFRGRGRVRCGAGVALCFRVTALRMARAAHKPGQQAKPADLSRTGAIEQGLMLVRDL